jgi:hypothetical protein
MNRSQKNDIMSSVDDKANLEPSVALTVQEAAELLRRTPVVLRELILALPHRAVGYHPGAGKWCIKEAVGHLTEEDKRDFVGRVELILHQEHPRLHLNDQDEVAFERNDCDKDIFELLDEFASVRRASVRFVEELSAGDLERTGAHPKIGLIHVGELLSRVALSRAQSRQTGRTERATTYVASVGKLARFLCGLKLDFGGILDEVLVDLAANLAEISPHKSAREKLCPNCAQACLRHSPSDPLHQENPIFKELAP